MFIILMLIFLYVAYKYLSNIYMYWHVRNVPYIKPNFLFGNFTDFFTFKSTIGKLLQNFYSEINTRYFGLYILTKPCIVVKDPEIIRSITVKDFNCFCDRYLLSYEKGDAIVSNMLVFAKNPQWKYLRSTLSPVFSSGKLKHMFSLIQEISNDMTLYLNRLLSSTNEVEAKELCGKFSTNVITSCAFGVNGQSFEHHDAPFRKYARMMFEPNIKNGIKQGCYFIAHRLVKLFKFSFFDVEISSFMRRVFWEVIEERKRSKEQRHDVIDVIKEYENNTCNYFKFEGDRVVAQAVQFYAAGFETVSSTMSFVLYELALHQEIQDKLRKEITDCMIQNNDINYQCLKDMRYLTMVLNETLRKYPVLPFLDRRCMQDYEVPNTNCIIPKGTPVYIPILGLHFDPKYFPNPHKFDPDRFSEENKHKVLPFTYLPFGSGPRSCIGARFSLLTAKIGLVEIIKNFKITPSSRTPKSIDFCPTAFFLISTIGIPVRLEKIGK